MTRGVYTSEFWLTSITSVAIAVMAVLVGYGVLTSDESVMWLALVGAVSPIAIAIIVQGYSKSRAEVKSEQVWADRAPVKAGE